MAAEKKKGVPKNFTNGFYFLEINFVQTIGRQFGFWQRMFETIFGFYERQNAEITNDNRKTNGDKKTSKQITCFGMPRQIAFNQRRNNEETENADDDFYAAPRRHLKGLQSRISAGE